ncbi:MAG: 3-isopropylmalate dehydratase, partial [Armatimonadota bacterium]
MPMTLTEKIIARAAGRSHVAPDDEVWANVDLAAMHDSSGPRRIAPTLERLGGRLWDLSRIVLAIDHFTPAANLRHAEILTTTRDWARKTGLPHFFDSVGVLHN